MNIYTTTTNRHIVTLANLAYAQDADGKVNPKKLRKQDKDNLNEVPNILTADILVFAARALPSETQHQAQIRNLPGSLVQIATQAADAHAQCIAQPNEKVYALAYPHIIRTNHHRYALSKYQLVSDEPDSIIEEDLTEEEMSGTCFIADLRLALFLTKASSGRFCDADFQIDPTHHPEYYIHNRITRQDGTVLIRDGTEVHSIQSLVQTAPAREQAIHLSAAEYQLAMCTTYLAMVQAAG